MDLNNKVLSVFKSFTNDIIKVFPEYEESLQDYLIMEHEDLSYIKSEYDLYIKSDSSGGDISIITN